MEAETWDQLILHKQAVFTPTLIDYFLRKTNSLVMEMIPSYMNIFFHLDFHVLTTHKQFYVI